MLCLCRLYNGSESKQPAYYRQIVFCSVLLTPSHYTAVYAGKIIKSATVRRIVKWSTDCRLADSTRPTIFTCRRPDYTRLQPTQGCARVTRPCTPHIATDIVWFMRVTDRPINMNYIAAQRHAINDKNGRQNDEWWLLYSKMVAMKLSGYIQSVRQTTLYLQCSIRILRHYL